MNPNACLSCSYVGDFNSKEHTTQHYQNRIDTIKASNVGMKVRMTTRINSNGVEIPVRWQTLCNEAVQVYRSLIKSKETP